MYLKSFMIVSLLLSLLLGCVKEPEALCTNCAPIAIAVKFIDSTGSLIIPDSLSVTLGDSIFTWNKFSHSSRISGDSVLKIGGGAGSYMITVFEVPKAGYTFSTYGIHVNVETLPNSEHCGDNIPNTVHLKILLKNNTRIIQDSIVNNCGC